VHVFAIKSKIIKSLR